MDYGGWYSSEVMAQSLNSTAIRREGRIEYIMSLEPLHANPYALHTSVGAVVNKDNVHWIALRSLDGQVWCLDSQKDMPYKCSEAGYLRIIRRHKDAYRIEKAPDAA